jgi:hypothetical protein
MFDWLAALFAWRELLEARVLFSTVYSFSLQFSSFFAANLPFHSDRENSGISLLKQFRSFPMTSS